MTGKHCRTCTCGPDNRLFNVQILGDGTINLWHADGSRTRFVGGPAKWVEGGHWAELGPGKLCYRLPDGQIAGTASTVT